MELKPKAAHAEAAKALAQSYKLVQHSTTTYIPANWKTEAIEPEPDERDRIWLPLTRKDKQRLANKKSHVLFANDAELNNFDFMLRQWAHEEHSHPTGILIRTEEGLRVLDENGTLIEPDGTFLPNFVRPTLNTDEKAKAEVFTTIKDWLNSEDEAHALLRHLALTLAPGWSAVKYVLLLGDGRNGKGLLLSMLNALFGAENVSNVTRQQIAAHSPVCTELNDKLLNVVFDGQMDYIKDSGLEKTLVAGEPGYVRVLYESGNTRVQTNALFIEALNKEPKTRDKSSALQKRMVRFWFPNIYALDKKFEEKMLAPEMLGAFLALLIDHYVCKHEAATALAPTRGSMDLQVNQMWVNSPMLQYLEHLIQLDENAGDKFIGSTIESHVEGFMAWRVAQNYTDYSAADAVTMFRDCFTFDWRTVRTGGTTKRKRKITGIKPEAQALIQQIKEGGNAVIDEDEEE